jgi:hypothetical protein
MTKQPTALCGDTLVVFEGPKRIAWRETDFSDWAPLGLWPDPREKHEIHRRIAHGQQMLVVLDEAAPVVSMLREELAAAPPALAALAEEPVGELVRLPVPTLDWLPGDLRARGLRFLARSTARVAGIPKALLPALIFEESPRALAHVRFAHRLDRRVRLDSDLDAIVAHGFAGAEARAGVLTEARVCAA